MSDASTLVTNDTVAAARPRRPNLLSARSLTRAGIILASGLIYIGWTGREGRSLDAAEGLGYALGIVGGVPMLLLLVYSFRKRLRLARFLGPTRHWFRAHMVLGVIGPVIILYHCNFKVGSLNSQVALYCTLLVAASGLVGRYLYAKIHHGLYGRKASLRELTDQLGDSAQRLSSRTGLIDDIRDELRGLVAEAMTPPDSAWESVARPASLWFRSRWMYYRLSWSLRRKLIARAVTSPAIAAHRPHLERVARRFLRQHLRLVRRVSQFNTFERLFSLWHVIHVPFFCMMVLSVVIHVLAVHIY